MKDFYFTIEAETRSEIKVKGSRFIAEILFVSALDEVRYKLEKIRKRGYNATHHCYAYILGFSGDQFKYSDDGEPNGTAGKPIYDLLSGRHLTNLLCVVTRYFGGTKLGMGGLVRAYSEAVTSVLEQSGKQRVFLTNSYRVRINFPLYDRWLILMKKFNVEVEKSEFGENVSMQVSVRKSMSKQLIAAFIDLTSAKGVIELIDDKSSME